MNQSDLQAVGLKPKDLVGIPWMVAFALRDDGWYLRRDIIWEKPNPMPESTRDRCTSAHEYIFHLTKSARYFYDAFAIRETGKSDPDSWKKAPAGWADNDGHHGSFHAGGRREAKKQRGHERKHQGIALWDGLSKTLQGMLMRNKRSVWTIATRPFKGAHFATFPSEIPITAIQAGTSHKGCCHVCGAPYERIIKRAGKVQMDRAKSKKARQVVEEYRGPVSAEGGVFNTGELPILETAGWRQTCECKISAAVPCTVLEPFAGSGTTLEAAARLGREYVGIEINEHDIKTLIEPRLAGINPLFTLFRDEQG